MLSEPQLRARCALLGWWNTRGRGKMDEVSLQEPVLCQGVKGAEMAGGQNDFRL